MALTTEMPVVDTTQSLSQIMVTRRSPMPDALIGPGPDHAEIEQLIEIGLRVPDHGRLGPWRLIMINGSAKQRWVDRLMALAEAREDAAKVRVSTRKLASSPLAIVVVSAPVVGHKVPEWEQTLSAGAVCMNILNGAHAMGFGGQWLTGWHAYDSQATALLGLGEGEKVAGVILIGSISEPAPERQRASAESVVRWLD